MKTKIKGRKSPKWSQVGKKQKWGIAAILAGALVIGIAVSYLFQTKKKSTGFDFISEPAATALVQLNTDTTQVKMSQPFTVTLTLDSAQNGVDAADFVINFDKNKLSVQNVVTGEFFRTYPVNSVSEGRIKVSGVAFFENNQLTIPKGKGVVARITFTPLRKGKTTIRIGRDKTTIASAGKNILNTSKIRDLEISIQ